MGHDEITKRLVALAKLKEEVKQKEAELESIGVISYFNNEPQITFSRYFELLRSNIELRKLAVIDELTGLPNFRAFKDELKKIICDYSKGENFAVVVVDIDNFKEINDQNGHEIGNCFLRGIANVLSENIRPSDFVCRFGGEEFIILLKCVEENTAVRICEDLRSTIEKTFIRGINTTASFGIALYNGSHAEDIVSAADTAMYESKKLGKNRVTVHKSRFARKAS